nr:restriction endonuclease subunit S [Nesterenkonia massiliensis]
MPKSWTWAAIGDVTRKSAKWDPRTSDDKFTYVDIAAVDANTKRITAPQTILGAEAPSRARQIIEHHDVLVSTVRPNLNAVAFVSRESHGAVASTGFSVLRPTESLHSRYLFHWVQSPRFIEQMVRQATGQSYPAVSDRIVRQSLLPLPPLEEQRRIATILDQATGIQDAAGRYSQILRAHRRTAFLKVLDDTPISHLPVEAVSAAVIDCPHSTPRWRESGVTCLRTANLGYGEWNWDDHRFVDEAQHTERTKRAELLPGDIVLSREGTVGVMAMVSPGMRASLGQRLVQVRPSDEINREYLMEALLHELHPTRVEHRMIGATAKRINVKALKQLLLPIPPRDVQDRFGSIAMKIRESQNQAEKRLAHVTTLTRSLQSRAFRGEL